MIEEKGNDKVKPMKELKDKKILVIAYSCEPNKGSEAAVGWNWIHLISQIFGKVYVLTRANNKPNIESAGLDKIKYEFIYYDIPSKYLFWKKSGKWVRIYYYIWQVCSKHYIKNLISQRKLDIDIVQHVTFVNDWLPSFFFKLGKPFVWGPIGSHDIFPIKFFQGVKDYILDRLRILLQIIFRNFDINFKTCVRRSNAIIGINDNVKNKIKLNTQSYNKFYVIPAIGMDEISMKFRNEKNCDDKVKILSVGRFVYFKNFTFTIDTFFEFQKNTPNSELWLLGKGYQENFLRNKIKKLGLEEKVKIINWLPRERAIELMGKADIFLFPSFESGGMVVLEAISQGIPVISLNKGGPSTFLPKELQVNIDKLSYNELTIETANLINRIYYNWSGYSEDILKNLQWQSKVNKLIEIYDKIL